MFWLTGLALGVAGATVLEVMLSCRRMGDGGVTNQ